MTELKSPPEEFRPMQGKDAFQAIAGLLFLVLNVTGVFWALLVKKPGTAGTRAYLLDAAGGFVLLLALSQNHWFPDCYAFQLALMLMSIRFLWHFFASLNSKTHIHTRCIGVSRFPGKGHTKLAWELLVGMGVGFGFILLGMEPFGLFILASAACASFKEGLIEQRDTWRSIQIADAMSEQEYAMQNYERWKRGERG